VAESSEKYRAEARELEERARTASDEWGRRALMAVAKRWRDLAAKLTERRESLGSACRHANYLILFLWLDLLNAAGQPLRPRFGDFIRSMRSRLTPLKEGWRVARRVP
jgi:hypothetical protein